MIVEEMKNYPQFAEKANTVQLAEIPAAKYYGKNYDDMQDRLPSVQKIKDLLGWEPQTSLREAIKLTLDWHADHPAKDL